MRSSPTRFYCGLLVAMLLITGSGLLYSQESPPRFRTTPLEPAPRTIQRQIQPGEMPESDLMKELPFREWGMRETSADALWRIGRPAVPALIETLKDPDAYVRVLGARALAHIGPQAEQAVPALITALDDPEPAVRQHAARALGQIGPAAADAIPRLIQQLQGPRR